MDIQSFKEDIAFDKNRIKTKIILETSFSKEIQILMHDGQIMKEHKTPYPILIHVLEGNIELGVETEIFLMSSGDIIALEGNIPHNLSAKENSIIRLSLSKFDTIERIKSVIEN